MIRLRLYTSSGRRAERVQTNNQGGRGSGPCLLRGGLDESRHVVLIALLVRVPRSVQGRRRAKQKAYSRLDGRLGHTFDIEGVKLFSSPTKLAAPLTLDNSSITLEKKLSVDLKSFQMCFKAYCISNPVAIDSIVLK